MARKVRSVVRAAGRRHGWMGPSRRVPGMTGVERLTDLPKGRWMWIVRFGDRAWVDDEEVPLEVFQQVCGVNMERESYLQRPVDILKNQRGH